MPDFCAPHSASHDKDLTPPPSSRGKKKKKKSTRKKRRRWGPQQEVKTWRWGKGGTRGKMGFGVKWWELDLKKKIGCGKSCQSVWHVINNQLTGSIVMTISNFFFFFENVLCAEGRAKHCVLRHLFCPWPQSTGQALLSPFQRWEKRGTGRRGEGWQNLQGLDSRFLKGFHHTHPAGLRPRIMDFIFLPVVNLFVPCEFFQGTNSFWSFRI